MKVTDRRVRRTRQLLEDALIDLLAERGYDRITVGQIADRAKVGRTSFYAHFATKDDLLMSCHAALLTRFRIGPLHPLSRQEMLAEEAPPGPSAASRHLEEARPRLSSVLQSKDGPQIMRRFREQAAEDIQANLRAAFENVETAVPLEILALYLAAAQVGLVQWWLEKRRDRGFEEMARAFHRLQRAAILDVLGPDR